MSGSSQSSLSGFLQRLLQHSTLAQDEQEAILQLRGEAFQVRSHRDIVLPGEMVEHACLVVEGLAGRFDEMRDGRRQLTAFHIPGDMCDLHSVVVPKPSWSVSALGTTTVLHLAHSDLLELANRFPAVALAFWRDTVVDASILAKWVGNLGRKDAPARLAHTLCEVGLRMELAGLGTRTCYRFEVTQEQLADAAGITAVHLNRTLQALRATELVQFKAQTVKIEDWDALAARAEFNPDYLLPSSNASRTPASLEPFHS